MHNSINGINVARQLAYIKQKYPQFETELSKSGKLLLVKGALKPTARSCNYKFRIEFQVGRRPKVYIISPVLIKNNIGKMPPHLYGDGSLCLYLPRTGQFSDGHWLGDTILPWVSLWLIYYENWLVNGYVWNGGGVHSGKIEDY
ncbi:hypothetical protein L0657_15640 [Dyadobacter sp. CY345]|uniref:hypothetical protein n=1 Tax=Dyadobacter sp. CY345 TaxID=2909335 RepID=UPI001F177136|nr:hypothetical protein [Dyadobacter sp. CY345]MCF2445395.1 hypothetical protein [Dyadobacter sp. CY345]